MSEAFLKYDEKNPPAGVDERGVLRSAGGGSYDVVINAKYGAYELVKGDFAAVLEKIQAQKEIHCRVYNVDGNTQDELFVTGVQYNADDDEINLYCLSQSGVDTYYIERDNTVKRGTFRSFTFS